MTPVLSIGLLFVVVYGFMAFVAIRRPLLARLAVREAVRRRGQTALVVGGLMIGAAGITAALVGADSAHDSSVLNSYRSWGQVDILVSAHDRFFPEQVATALSDDPSVRPLVDGVQGGIELVGSASDVDRRQGQSQVSLVAFDPARQASFGRFRLVGGGTSLGDDLGADGVLLSRQLAHDLHARTGDRLVVSVELPGQVAPGRGVPLRVAGIARSEGPGAYGLRPTVFLPLPSARSVLGIDGINVVRISAKGGLESGVEGGERALPAIRRGVSSERAPLPLEARPVKRQDVDAAEEGTKFLLYFLLAMSMLIVAAGSALVVNLVMMLAEERRPRLAVLRALGLTRGGLVRLSSLEGAIYSLLAATVGTAVGLLAGRVVAVRFARAFAQFFGSAVDLHFTYPLHPATLAVSFGAGALITLVTVYLAARRTARMSIPAAIRNLPEPAEVWRPRRWRQVAKAIAGLAGLTAAVGGDPVLRLLGGIVVILVAASFLRGRMPERVHASLAGLVLAVWAFAMVSATSNESDPGVFFAVFTLAVLAAVFGLSILASANLRLVEWGAGLLGRLSRGLRPTLRPPLAYLARRPLRTGITAGVFGVILAILALFSVFLALFRPQLARDSAGYDVRVLSTGTAHVQLPASVTPLVARRAAIATRGYVGPLDTAGFKSGTIFIPMFNLSPSQFGSAPARLTAKDDRFDSDQDVWTWVRDHPGWVISTFGSPGSTIELQGDNGAVTLRVAANQQQGILDGVIGSPDALAAFTGGSLGETLLLDAKPSVSAAHLASTVERSLFSEGVDAATTRSLLEKSYRANRTFFSVIQILMQMGLVVGILALGIVSLRAVVERRHVIGVLRAIGYRRRMVMGGLMAEGGVAATLGVVVGVAAGFVMGFIYWRQFGNGSPFGVDGPMLWSSLALVYGAVVIVTLWPAWRASRLPPAEAVRYTE